MYKQSTDFELYSDATKEGECVLCNEDLRFSKPRCWKFGCAWTLQETHSIKKNTHFDSNSCHQRLELTASELQKLFQQMWNVAGLQPRPCWGRDPSASLALQGLVAPRRDEKDSHVSLRPWQQGEETKSLKNWIASNLKEFTPLLSLDISCRITKSWDQSCVANKWGSSKPRG